MSSPIYGDDMEKLWPISYEGQSDSACFDNALELLFQGGYSLPHAMMMLIPEAWAGNPLMDDDLRAFYEYNAALMEPWDGPAAIAFTDGRVVGATLDRNGLRPARYLETKDGFVLLASEMGVLDIPEENIARKWRLQPGKMLLIDLEKGKTVSDEDLQDRIGEQPSLQGMACQHANSRSRSARCGAAPDGFGRAAAGFAAGIWLLPGRPKVPDGTHGADRTGSDRCHGARTRRFRRCRPDRSLWHPISSSCSPR